MPLPAPHPCCPRACKRRCYAARSRQHRPVENSSGDAPPAAIDGQPPTSPPSAPRARAAPPSNPHRRQTARAAPRGFLPWRLSDAGSQYSPIGHDEPASETLHNFSRIGAAARSTTTRRNPPLTRPRWNREVRLATGNSSTLRMSAGPSNRSPATGLPWRSINSATSGSIWWPQPSHQTIARTRAVGARPSVNDGPASPSGRKRFIFTVGARNGGKGVVAGDQGQGIERRRSPRVAAQKHATIAFRGRAFPCNLVDEFESGVRLADFPIASCPDKFALHSGESEPRQCRVVWRSPVALGVR